MYASFKKLNQKVIGPAVEEINRLSDFRVDVDYQKEGRKVFALKFKVHRVPLLAQNTQRHLFPDLQDRPVVVHELLDVGLSEKDAWAIWQQGLDYVNVEERPKDLGEDKNTAFLQYIRAKIHLLKRRQASGKVDNSTGFLLEAIKKNYANPEFEQEQKRQVAAAGQQARREREKQAQALEQQKAAREKARDQELDALSGQVAAEALGVLDQAASELLAENFGFRQFYDRDKSALENYQARKAVQAFLNPYLERHDPARFEAVKQHYAAQIAAVDGQIAAL